MKLLFVIPRFGPAIVGGAERLGMELATRAIAADDDVEIATTCAVDHHTWENVQPSGVKMEDGVLVRRFPVTPRKGGRHAELLARLSSTRRLTYLEEIELLGNDVWSADLQLFLERHGPSYDLILFMPYLFGTTFWGIQAWPERSALIPCLHDEPVAHFRSVRDVINASAGCIFNSNAEERLARRLYRIRSGGVVGVGFDVPQEPTPPRSDLGRYFVYVGRLEEGKRVQVAVEHVHRLARDGVTDARLVLIGSGPYEPPRKLAGSVVQLGWLTEQEKRSVLAGAIALVHPSELESFSIVLMEAWREGIPALVAAGSAVMVEHCEASGGGLPFADYDDFAQAAALLVDQPTIRAHMGASGRRYVETSFSWEIVAERFQSVTRRIVDLR